MCEAAQAATIGGAALPLTITLIRQGSIRSAIALLLPGGQVVRVAIPSTPQRTG